MRIFLDANILFSAAQETSATRKLVVLASGSARLFSNSYAALEARRNISNKRPQLTRGLEEIIAKLHINDTLAEIDIVSLEDKDQPILAGAIGCVCDYLWTGDKTHFGHLYGKTISGVMVVSSTQLFTILSLLH